jgi:hypothetical protein
MCFGSPPPATIVTPDTRAYDRMADLQIAAMQQQQQGEMMIKQLELNQAIERQKQTLTEVRDFKVERANDTAANAQRMAALIGAPPPEPTAKAPVVGGDRAGMAKSKGKKSLRIDRVDSRPAATTQAAGTGLNITTAS